MKKLFFWFLLPALSLINLNSVNANENEGKNKTGTIKLSKSDFIAKIADYESNSEEWKYLGDKPALIDFYADWCGPCKRIAPILEELAKEYKDEIYIYKIDVDKEKELAALFGVTSIPSLLFIPMNDLPQMAQGALPRESLEEVINQFLLGK